MRSRPITFLWLWPATDHEPHCWHMPINKIWRRTESTQRSGWWCSHMAGIYSNYSTREIIMIVQNHSFHLQCTCGWQVKLCDPVNMCHIERFIGESRLTIKCCRKCGLFTYCSQVLRCHNVAWSVCLSVCLCVRYTGEPCKTHWSDWDAICKGGGGQTHVGLRDHVLDWVQIPQERGTSKGNMCLTHLAQWARPVFAPAIV